MKVINNVIISFLLLFLSIQLGVAQKIEPKEVVVGNKVPDPIMKIINNKQGHNPKPTIINFWATWCVPCIKELTLLDSVLKKNENINVLSVTYEQGEKIEAFLDRNNDLKSGRLTFLTADTLLRNCFPHRVLPHNIWIDAEGVVKYITGGADMNAENILAFIEKRPINAKNKKDNIKFNPFEPFHLSDSEFVYRSIVTKRVDGIFSGEMVHPVGYADKKKILRAFCFNSTLNTMLWLAVNHKKSLNNYFNIMRIETKDSLRFFTPNQAPLSFKKSKYTSVNEWRADHTHCYELSLPSPMGDSLFYSYMLNDLKRIFNIEVDVIEDSILCSVITADNKQLQPEPKQSDSTFMRINKNGLIAKNVSVLALFEYLSEKVKDGLNDMPVDPPFIDKTAGMRISINMAFKEGIPKYEFIKKSIEEKFGIKIRHQIEKYKITIIKDMS